MASGRINGVVTGNDAIRKYTFWVEWSSSQNVSAGTSTVTANAYVQRTDGYAQSAYNNDVAASSKKISIDGTTYTSGSKGIDTRNGRKVLIASGSKTVSHNADGYRNVTITASFPRVASSLTGGTLSGTVSLGYIDMQPPALNVSASSGTNSITLQVSSDDALSDIQYRGIGVRGWVSVGGGTSKNIVISDLSPNTSYSVEVWAKKSSNGRETYKTVSVKTVLVPLSSISLLSDTIAVGTSKAYTPVISPENASIKTLTYASDNPSVATVKASGSGYVVQAVSAGTATILATATDGSGKTASATITVTQPVTGLEIDVDALAVPVGGSANISYTILPANATNQAVTAVSEDESIATVSGTTVVGVGNGVTTITLTTVDGGFTATVSVLVQGSFVWYDYPAPLDILNAVDVQHIHANMTVLRGLILLTGEAVDDFKAVDAQVNTAFRSMRGLLQAVEDNLTALNATSFRSGFYRDHVTVGQMATDREGIWRWLQVINDIYRILAGTAGMWNVLLCSDGYPTIGGEHIKIRGDLID